MEEDGPDTGDTYFDLQGNAYSLPIGTPVYEQTLVYGLIEDSYSRLMLIRPLFNPHICMLPGGIRGPSENNYDCVLRESLIQTGAAVEIHRKPLLHEKRCLCLNGRFSHATIWFHTGTIAGYAENDFVVDPCVVYAVEWRAILSIERPMMHFVHWQAVEKLQSIQPQLERPVAASTPNTDPEKTLVTFRHTQE